MRLGRADDGANNRGAAREQAAHILIVASSDARRDALSSALRPGNVICGLAESTQAATTLLDDPVMARQPRFDVVVLDVPVCGATTLRFIRTLGDRGVGALVVCPHVSFDEAVEAMRAGACDIVSSSIKPKELLKRVRSAVAQQRNLRTAGANDARAGQAMSEGGGEGGGNESVLRLPETPGTIPASARPAPSPARSTGDAGRASKPLKATPVTGEAQSEQEAIEDFVRGIRYQLDVEALLRSALEFLLAQCGPMNAAVFLPSTSGDFSLGAYVNYTCPKDAAEILLDHLANVAAPRLEKLHGVQLFTTREQIIEHVGESVDWMLDNHVLAFTCRSAGEGLAVFMLFRDGRGSFNAAAQNVCRQIAVPFADQLARVVRIHHRHLPRDQWGTLGDPAEGEGDAGNGGMAA